MSPPQDLTAKLPGGWALAFDDLLDQIGATARDRSGSTFSEAEYAGPWTVRERDDGFAPRRPQRGGAVMTGTPDGDLAGLSEGALLERLCRSSTAPR